MLLCSSSSLLLPSSEPVPIRTIGWFLLVFASILVGVGMIVSFLPIAKSPSGASPAPVTEEMLQEPAPETATV